MKLPQMKQEVAIAFSYDRTRLIRFFASADAAQDFARFGHLSYIDGLGYHLSVDPRYDFAEVLAWIQAYGQDDASRQS